MRLDRKLLLIAPTIVLVCVVAGIIYAALQLNALSSVGETFGERSDFIAAVDRGEKVLEERQALNIIHAQFDVETKRTAALIAARDLLVVLAGIAGVSLAILAIGVRSIPREHWPRMSLRRSTSAS